MNDYSLQLKLHTLALCDIIEDKKLNHHFEFEGMTFDSWGYNDRDGHKLGAWLVTGETQAQTMREAKENFFVKLNDLIPKIAMISQCYTEHINEPYLVHRLDNDIALFHYSKEVAPVPLHFTKESLATLTALKDKQLSNEFNAFFYYWNDMLNSTGYSAKLLLICSALEALGKALDKEKGLFRDEVLGDELRKKVFENNNLGIRHRLTHGDYFSAQDNEDYLSQIYSKIIEYFNSDILKVTPINKNVVEPQRHFFGNKEFCDLFLKKKPESNASFDIKEIMESIENSELETVIYEHFQILDRNEIDNI